jgi:GT2 family glycosyltransferase
MSYRRSAIEGLHFNRFLRGSGAQVYNDMDFSLAVRRRGWKLIYDPKVAVDHYPAKRFDENQRYSFNETAFLNEIHNETLVLMTHLVQWRRIIFLVWGALIGTQRAFGLLQWFRFMIKKDPLSSKKFLISLQGRWQGIRTWMAIQNCIG